MQHRFQAWCYGLFWQSGVLALRHLQLFHNMQELNQFSVIIPIHYRIESFFRQSFHFTTINRPFNCCSKWTYNSSDKSGLTKVLPGHHLTDSSARAQSSDWAWILAIDLENQGYDRRTSSRNTNFKSACLTSHGILQGDLHTVVPLLDNHTIVHGCSHK